MSSWPSAKARRVFAALKRIGWRYDRTVGSHKIMKKDGWAELPILVSRFRGTRPGNPLRSHAGVNRMEGVGMIEAPRGVLIHHYKVDESGAITWANLIVATGHNNLAINHSVSQVARHFIDGNQIKEGMLNRVSAVVRAYYPCLSCSTHADGTLALEIALRGPGGEVLDRIG